MYSFGIHRSGFIDSLFTVYVFPVLQVLSSVILYVAGILPVFFISNVYSVVPSRPSSSVMGSAPSNVIAFDSLLNVSASVPSLITVVLSVLLTYVR